MNIIWNPNPLRTVVLLEPHEKELLWHKLKIEDLIDRLYSVHFELTHERPDKSGPDMEQIIQRETNPDHYLANDGERSPVDERADTLQAWYLNELQSAHGGDCTCVPCSCCKCHAEELLGINTLDPYPGKHTLYHVWSAFTRYDHDTKTWSPDKTIDEAINTLRGNNNIKAAEWLEAYRDKHFKEKR